MPVPVLQIRKRGGRKWFGPEEKAGKHLSDIAMQSAEKIKQG
jgi:hypothetical protein